MSRAVAALERAQRQLETAGAVESGLMVAPDNGGQGLFLRNPGPLECQGLGRFVAARVAEGGFAEAFEVVVVIDAAVMKDAQHIEDFEAFFRANPQAAVYDGPGESDNAIVAASRHSTTFAEEHLQIFYTNLMGTIIFGRTETPMRSFFLLDAFFEAYRGG